MKKKILKEQASSSHYLPQLNKPFTNIVQGLEQENIGFRPVIVRVGQLKPLQNTIEVPKMQDFSQKIKDAGEYNMDPIFISNDDHILDGRHRGAGLIHSLGKDSKIKCIRIDLDKDNGVRMLNKINDKMEFKQEQLKNNEIEETKKPKENVLRLNKKQLEEYTQKVIQDNLEEYDLSERDVFDDDEEDDNDDIVSPHEIKYGDLVDFGSYGDLYVVSSAGDRFWVTDQEEHRTDRDAPGWFINKGSAKKIIERRDRDDLSEDEHYKSDEDIESEFQNPKVQEFQFPGKLTNQKEGMIVIEFPYGEEHVGGGSQTVVEYYNFDKNTGELTFKTNNWFPEETYNWIKNEIMERLRGEYSLSEENIEEMPRTHSSLRSQRLKSQPEKMYASSRMRPAQRDDVSEENNNQDKNYVVTAYNKNTGKREELIDPSDPSTKQEAEEYKDFIEASGIGNYRDFRVVNLSETHTTSSFERIRPEFDYYSLNEKDISEDQVNNYLKLKEKYGIENEYPSEKLSEEDQQKFMEELNKPSNKKRIVRLNEKQMKEMVEKLKNEYASASLPISGEPSLTMN